MNPNTMTIDDIRDELARVLGYVRGTRKGQIRYGIAGPGCAFVYTLDEIIPATLDEAAKLPEGWWYWVNYHGRTDGLKAGEAIREAVCCEAVSKHGLARVRVEADTELLARFRLRLACTIADDNSTQH